jgi:hypothetical protein
VKTPSGVILIKVVNASEIFAYVGYSIQRPQWHGPRDQKQKKKFTNSETTQRWKISLILQIAQVPDTINSCLD